MINILKPFEALGTRLYSNEFSRATLRLTLYYVVSTAAILGVSSLLVLTIFTPPEAKPPLRLEESKSIEVEHDEWGLYEVREHLGLVIVSVDAVILVVVSVLAYFFARRTLLPIKLLHERQRAFMGDVAHELRTPLAVMQTGAETILRKERAVDEYKNFVGDVKEEAERLTRLSNQLLQLLKSNGVADMTVESVSVSVLLRDELRRFTPYATAHEIELIADIPSQCSVDTNKDALIEIVQNLIKNAIDYSQRKGVVTVRAKEVDATLEISIEDTGIGIAKEHQGTIFGRFKKVSESRTQNSDSGSGLGLAIVQALVTQLGGRILLESEVGKGTKVTVVLPVRHS